MKISVLGNIIDTKDIYQITPIEENVLNKVYFKFEIKFFNSKDLPIHYEFDFKELGEFVDTYKNDVYNKHKNKIEKLRNTIIDYWNEDKSEILQIEFE